MAAIYEAFLVQSDERFAHRARQLGRQGVRRARPVAGAADRLELLEDSAASLAHEDLGALHEFHAADVEARLSLGVPDELLYDVLRGDSGVIGAGHPERL